MYNIKKKLVIKRSIKKPKSSKSKAIIRKPKAKKVKPAPQTTWIEKVKIGVELAKLAKEVWPMIQDINWSDLLNYVISLF